MLVKCGMSAYEIDLCCAEQDKEAVAQCGNGVCVCVSCGNELFSSTDEYPYNEKYPRLADVCEFTSVVKDSVALVDENVYGIERVSFVCKKCGLNIGFVATREGKTIVYCASTPCLRFVSGKDKEVRSWAPHVDVMESSQIMTMKKDDVKKNDKNNKREKRKIKEEEKEEEEESQVSGLKAFGAFAVLLSSVGFSWLVGAKKI